MAQWSGSSARLPRDEYERTVLGMWGDHLRRVSAEFGIPLRDLVHNVNDSFALVNRMREARRNTEKRKAA